jgi:hypothetical protein
MTTELVSQIAFVWCVTILTGGVAGAWFVYDIINMIRTRGADARDPLIRDRRFGYAMGIVIGFAGVLGCLRFHDVV